MINLLQQLLSGTEKFDLLLFVTNPPNSASNFHLNQIFEYFYKESKGTLISCEDKIEQIQSTSNINFIDSMFSFCYCNFSENLNDLYNFLQQNKPIASILYENLMDDLHPSLLDYFQRNASWISFSDDSGYLKLKHLKRNGKYVEEDYQVYWNEGLPAFEQISRSASKAKVENSFNNLTFNVGLSEKQKENKDSLFMPYWNAQASHDKEAIISYFHDKVDDFDEDDPDDDLEF